MLYKLFKLYCYSFLIRQGVVMWYEAYREELKEKRRQKGRQEGQEKERERIRNVLRGKTLINEKGQCIMLTDDELHKLLDETETP